MDGGNRGLEAGADDATLVYTVEEAGGAVLGEASVVTVVVVVDDVLVDDVLIDDGACDGGCGGGTDGTDGDDIIPALSPLKNSSRFACICKRRIFIYAFCTITSTAISDRVFEEAQLLTLRGPYVCVL